MESLDISTPTPTRRLTREESRQQTRERLLHAAADVFRRQGYAGASMEAVAEAAGYSKGAVYSNFETKADLYVAMMKEFKRGTEDLPTEDQSLEAYIDGLERSLERQVTEDPQWVRLSAEAWLAAASDPRIREGAGDWRTQMGHMIERQLDEAGLELRFTGRELGILLGALAEGLALDHHLEPDAIDPKLLGRAARVLSGLESAQATPRSGVDGTEET
jgi:AcrR family transcriptional regulator